METEKKEKKIEFFIKENEEVHDVSINEIVIIAEEDHITADVLELFELTEIISQRIGQIEKNGRVFCDIGGLTKSGDIAIKELLDRKCPLSIKRHVYTKDGVGYHEIKDTNKMRFRIANLSSTSPSINDIKKKLSL